MRGGGALDLIDLEQREGVFVLTMRAGENRLNGPFLRAFHDALDRVEASSGPAALVTTGEGRFFSNGLDLEGLADGPDSDASAVMQDLHRLLGRLLAFSVATVTAINGHAFAGGAMLALAHDFRVMRSDRGYICLPEVDLGTGLPLTPGMYALLSARLSKASCHEALITGRRYTAGDAVDREIVHEERAAEDVLPRAVEIACGLASKDRATLAAIKRGLFAPALGILESS